ncbi:MAG: PAS domain-containing protein [Myxococcota bacterium]|nr:PAS domain-containing protein [Myxococcota bacterium]
MTDAQRLARLEAQLAELESLYGHAPVGLCFVDADLRFQRVNERMAAINGRPVAEHIGRRVEEMVPSIAEQVGPAYRRILRTGEPVVGLEVRGKLPSDPFNEHVWLMNHHPVRSPEGELQGISTVVVDVTQMKRDEEALAVASDRLAEAQRVAGVGSWEWDILADTVWWSDELYRIMGKRKHEFTPSLDAFYEMIHPTDRRAFRNQIEATLQRDEPYELDLRVQLDEGGEVLLHATAVLERSPEGLPARLVGTAQEVTAGRASRRGEPVATSSPVRRGL